MSDLKTAIAAIKAGNNIEAQQILRTVLQADQNNVQAWLLMTRTGLNAEQQVKCFERVLTIEPGNELAKRELAKLKTAAKPQSGLLKGGDESAVEPEAPATAGVATKVAEAEPKPEAPPEPTKKPPMLRRGWVIVTLSITGIIVILCAVAVLVIVSPMLGQSAAVAAPTKTPTGAPSLPHPAPETIIFEGSGDMVKSFEAFGIDAILVGGFHLGERTFAVTVKDSSGTVLGIPVHCIGGCTAEGIVRLRGDGVYYLEILAYDEWEVDITPLGD